MKKELVDILDEISSYQKEYGLLDNTTWRHKKSNVIYTVHRLCVNESDNSILVSYIDTNTFDINYQIFFVRPIWEFVEKFEFVSQRNIWLTDKEFRDWKLRCEMD